MSRQEEFSYAKYALFTLGAGALVLVLTGLLVVALKGVSPTILLVLALGGFVGGIAAMAFVSRRMLKATATSGDPDKADKPRNG